MKQTKTLIVVSTVLVLAASVLLWSLGLFSGLDAQGIAAAVIGIFLSSAVGIALMALMFHSNRSRRDREVYEQTKRLNGASKKRNVFHR